MGKKVGCNFEDVNRIKEWANQGKTVGQISTLLGIEEKAVAMNMPLIEDSYNAEGLGFGEDDEA